MSKSSFETNASLAIRFSLPPKKEATFPSGRQTRHHRIVSSAPQKHSQLNPAAVRLRITLATLLATLYLVGQVLYCQSV
ncbi:unnamed protein product [Protopolystoma xenopodis]|uniref:Uncharacterized protein n=1 Tax=Protopolystoma xenopodis TaxID=117903 RepID=A0A3S5AJL5_9PLAT|nr:unnamed protein product [Protopolystoma xenopodis]